MKSIAFKPLTSMHVELLKILFQLPKPRWINNLKKFSWLPMKVLSREVSIKSLAFKPKLSTKSSTHLESMETLQCKHIPQYTVTVPTQHSYVETAQWPKLTSSGYTLQYHCSVDLYICYQPKSVKFSVKNLYVKHLMLANKRRNIAHNQCENMPTSLRHQ